jgi:hypothetical protein
MSTTLSFRTIRVQQLNWPTGISALSHPLKPATIIAGLLVSIAAVAKAIFLLKEQENLKPT